MKLNLFGNANVSPNNYLQVHGIGDYGKSYFIFTIHFTYIVFLNEQKTQNKHNLNSIDSRRVERNFIQ